uniref:IS200/IS605 family transposase n=1 Tax=Nakamurella lactea TaxID=459515 RepID=UPI0012B673F6
MRELRADFDCELVEFNGEGEHVHPLINFPPKVALARLVNSLKGVSSRLMRKSPLAWPGATTANKLWSGSYFAGAAGGAPLDALRTYIDNQNPPQQACVGLNGDPPPPRRTTPSHLAPR